MHARRAAGDDRRGAIAHDPCPPDAARSCAGDRLRANPRLPGPRDSLTPAGNKRPKSAMYDVVVVGGGVMGMATAYSLLKRGVRRVCVLERHTVGHDRAASTDNTKAIRYEYADGKQYSLMVG